MGSHDLTKHHKVECVRICKETLKLLNDGEHHLISKILTGDETCVPFYGVPTHLEGEVWVFEDNPKPTMAKKQRALDRFHQKLVKAIKLEGQLKSSRNE